MVSPITVTTVLNPNQEMTDFDYKKYSLENLENWMNDAISSSEATPKEIYDVIVGVVKESYYHHKDQVSRANELLALLNGNGGWTVEDVMKEKEYYEPSMPPWGHSDLEYAIHHKEPLSCDKDDSSPECKGAWNDFWENVDEEVKQNIHQNGYDWTPLTKNDKVIKWRLPVQQSGEDYYVEFPDDLLEAANLKEGDQVEWVDQGGGAYLLRKV